MSSNRTRIVRALGEVWDTQGRKFVTFEPESSSGPQADRWIQFLDGEINLRWLLAEDPKSELARRGVALPRDAVVRWWVPHENAVIDAGDTAIDAVADLIDALFTRFVAATPQERVAVRVDVHD